MEGIDRVQADIPRINIAFYCETKELYDVARQSSIDRRLSKSKISVYSGGISGAIETYSNQPTPDLLIIESNLSVLEILSELEGLSEVCEQHTQVMVAGRVNDIDMYRELKRHGIVEYIILPITPNLLIQCIANIYINNESINIAPTISFIGSSGGVGNSILAQNIAFTLSNKHNMETLLFDLDIAYGSAQMNWNMENVSNIKDIIKMSSFDEGVIRNIRTNVIDNLYMIGSPIDPSFDINIEADIEEKLDSLILESQKLHDVVVFDIPSGYIDTYKKMAIMKSSHIYIVSMPTLKSIRGAIILSDTIYNMRPNDPKPNIIVNQFGIDNIVSLDKKQISKSLDKDADCYVEYNPEVIERAIAEGLPLCDIDAKSQAVKDIEGCVYNFFGRKKKKEEKSNHFPEMLSKLFKV